MSRGSPSVAGSAGGTDGDCQVSVDEESAEMRNPSVEWWPAGCYLSLSVGVAGDSAGSAGKLVLAATQAAAANVTFVVEELSHI